MLSPHDINTKQFTAVRLREGYAQNEVDEFLDEVADQLQVTQTRLAAAEERVKVLERAGDSRPTAIIPVIRDAEPVAPAATATGILALAQETADKHIAKAKSDGAALLGDARAEAARVKNAAAATAHEIKTAAEAEAARLKSEGVAEKQAVLDDIEARHGQVSGALGQLQNAGAGIREALREALATYERQVPS